MPDIRTLTRETLRVLSSNPAEWTRFLRTAGQHYKRPFGDQVLIYAQRPEATALATLPEWNSERLNRRWINRGAKGIALLPDSGSSSLRYVFDVSDTNGNLPAPALWELRDEHHAAVMHALNRDFLDNEDAPEDTFHNILMLAVEAAVADSRPDYADRIRARMTNSELATLDDEQLDSVIADTVFASAWAAVAARCTFDMPAIVAENDLAGIAYFNTPATLTELGVAVSDLSESILRGIERAIRTVDREKERGMSHEQHQLRSQRRLPDSDLTLQPRIGTWSKFGTVRENFLRQHRPGIYEEMRLMDSLHEHLAQIDHEANTMLETLEARLLEANPLPQTDDTMELVRHRNRIREQATEIVLSDLIHS